jgi:uracil-DNA glycosylase family 4
MMLVGEQPGDREDLAGHPFVGPAGRLLDQALAEAGINREEVYVTNVVKHFKWVPAERGKRRIHKKPSYSEITACRPWLDAEIAVLKPEVAVCLGATAAQALLGKEFGGYPTKWGAGEIQSRAICNSYSSPIFHIAHHRSGDAASTETGVCGGSEKMGRLLRKLPRAA